ncbi:hypothetical protein MAP00_008751 [Monascus purpureus]|nr:hypothetical protein MAP00_008751 [Monascus purpureus]
MSSREGSFKAKIRSLLPRSPSQSGAEFCDTRSEITLTNEGPSPRRKEKEYKGAREPALANPYNGDQCFGSCCRGGGYPR